MRAQLLRAVERNGGVITRSAALRVVRQHVVDDAIRAGVLRTAFPGTYVLAETEPEQHALLRLRAAAAYTGGAVSHLDALAVWRLLPPAPHYVRPPDAPVHVTVSAERGPSRCPGLVTHRRKDFTLRPPEVAFRDGLPLVRLEQALVESWPLLPVTERRAPVIVAVRDRRTTAARLIEQLERHPTLRGRRALRTLIDAVGAGCHSELELYGHDRVLRDRRLPCARAQVPIRLPWGTVYLDRYFEAEMLAVEFDGAAYHGSAAQRERDLRRDAALAAIGIQTVRLSHQRLSGPPTPVVEELLMILAARRRQMFRPAS